MKIEIALALVILSVLAFLVVYSSDGLATYPAHRRPVQGTDHSEAPKGAQRYFPNVQR